MDVLPHITNVFGGVIIDPESLVANPDQFRVQLAHSLSVWKADEFKLAWLEVPIEKSALIPIAVEADFFFHHSSENYLMLTYRLERNAFIPAYSTHYIGAGGVVLNENNEILVVSEKHRRDRSRPYYKLPGGALSQGEDLAEAVIREVLEETGVLAKYETLACFRHWHGYRYGKSDIYFVSRLSALSQEITRQDEEIDECLWMPIEEYLGSEYVGDFNKLIVRAALESPGFKPIELEGYGGGRQLEFFMPAEMEP